MFSFRTISLDMLLVSECQIFKKHSSPSFVFSRSCPSTKRLTSIEFTGEENSRVQAHVDGDEFSAHILTDEAEYNVEVRDSVIAALVTLYLHTCQLAVTDINYRFFLLINFTFAFDWHPEFDFNTH